MPERLPIYRGQITSTRLSPSKDQYQLVIKKVILKSLGNNFTLKKLREIPSAKKGIKKIISRRRRRRMSLSNN